MVKGREGLRCFGRALKGSKLGGQAGHRGQAFEHARRFSTREQSRSGLGIGAQRAAVACSAEVEGREVAAEITEVETGALSDVRSRSDTNP